MPPTVRARRRLPQVQGLALALCFLAAPVFALEDPAPAATPLSRDEATSAALTIAGTADMPLDERLTRLEALAESNPKNEYVWAALGETRVAAGADDQALAAFDRAVDVNPDLYSAWHWVGTLNKRQQRDLVRAELAFRQALEKGAPRASTLNELAVTLAMQDRLKDALATWEQAIAADPDWGVLYNNAIKAALGLNNMRKARELFEKSLAAERFEENAVLMWGEHLAGRGRHREAAKEYALALETRPGSNRIRYYYAAALHEAGDKAAGIAEMEAVRDASTSPADADTRRAALRSLFAFNHPKEERDFQRAVKLVFDELLAGREPDPKAQLRDLERALKLLDPIAAKFPDFFNARFVRGVAYRMLGRTEEARTELKRALELSPGEPNAHIQYALLLRDLKEYPEAVVHARAATDQSPRDPTILMNAGLIFVDAGNCAGAREMASRVSALVGPGAATPLTDEIAIRCPQ